MTDDIAETARLWKVAEAVVAELARQGVAEAVAERGFDPVEMARAVIKAADGDVAPMTWLLLRGLPPDSPGTGLDQLGPQLDQLDGRQGAEVGSVAAFHDQEPILPLLHIEHVVVAELIQPLASYLRPMPHHHLHVRPPQELAYARLRVSRDCSA
jgi:hypothetical protein